MLKWLTILLIAALWCVPARAQQPVVVGNDCPPGAASTTSTSGVTVSCVLEGTGNRWVWKAGGTGGSGTPAGPQNTIQKNNPPGTFAASGISDDGTTIKNGEDTSFLGPNPVIDVRAYGARSFAATTTCTITSGTKAMTVGAASGLINGDGIVCRGAGAGNSMTTPAAPTVASSAVYSEMNTGRVVTWALGSTTYQYQIVAVDIGGGYTLPSTATSIANGPATLGAQSVTVSSWTRANNIITINTSGNHNLSVSEGITITGVDGNIDGTFVVLAVNSATQFTYQGSQDTRMGAPTTGSAGQTVSSVLCNHISWTAVTGAFKYLIYGRTAGSMTLLGESWPTSNNVRSGDPKWLTFDDYGSISVPPTLPDWVPNTPPGSAKNDDLVTTITAGGGTTSLTVANNAGNTVSGTTLKFDNAPNIITAANAAVSQKGVLYFPASTGAYNVNSVLFFNIFPNPLSIRIAGHLTLFDTLYANGTLYIRGEPQVPVLAAGNFPWQDFPLIDSQSAYPAIFAPIEPVHISYVSITGGNNSFLVLQDANGNIPSSSFDHIDFGTGSGNPDDLSTQLAIRGNGNDTGYQFSNLSFGPGSSATSSSPLLLLSGGVGNITMDHIFLNRRGMYFGVAPNAAFIDWLYTEGGLPPEIFIDNVNANVSTTMDVRLSIQDTTNAPTITYLGGITGLLRITGTNGPIGFPTVTGPGGILLEFPNSAGTGKWNTYQNTFMSNRLQGSALEGILSTAVTTTTSEIENLNMLMGANYQFGVESAAAFMPAPVVTVNAGGTIATGAHVFNVAPVFPTSGAGFAEGPSSLTSASVNLTTGNQSISFPITPVAGAVGYDLYDNFFSVQCNAPFVSGGGTTTISWNGTPARCGQNIPQVPVGAPTSMSANGVFAPTVTATTVSAGSIINPTQAPWIWTGPGGSCGTPPAVTSTSGYSLCLGSSGDIAIDASFNGGAWKPILTSTSPLSWANLTAGANTNTGNFTSSQTGVFTNAQMNQPWLFTLTGGGSCNPASIVGGTSKLTDGVSSCVNVPTGAGVTNAFSNGFGAYLTNPNSSGSGQNTWVGAVGYYSQATCTGGSATNTRCWGANFSVSDGPAQPARLTGNEYDIGLNNTTTTGFGTVYVVLNGNGQPTADNFPAVALAGPGGTATFTSGFECQTGATAAGATNPSACVNIFPNATGNGHDSQEIWMNMLNSGGTAVAAGINYTQDSFVNVQSRSSGNQGSMVWSLDGNNTGAGNYAQYAISLKATATLSNGQLVKIDTANADSVVVCTTADTHCIGFVAGSTTYCAAGGIHCAINTVPGSKAYGIVGTGTCAIGNFVIVDTTTNGRVKCTAVQPGVGAYIGDALSAQGSVGGVVDILTRFQ